MRSQVMGAIFGALLVALPAQAENTLPSAQRQEILIKTTLVTFNDANLTGNYEVLHAKLAKPFRDKFSSEKLKQAFKAFVDQKIDLWPVVLIGQNFRLSCALPGRVEQG